MRPVSIVGLAIMIFAVLAGFIPSLWSILLLFITTLLGGHLIRRNETKETYDLFVKWFGYGVCIFNIIASAMIFGLTQLPYIDRASGAFLNLMVALVIFTLIKNNSKSN